MVVLCVVTKKVGSCTGFLGRRMTKTLESQVVLATLACGRRNKGGADVKMNI